MFIETQKLRKEHWTIQELEILRKDYPTMRTIDLSRTLSRSFGAIQAQARQLKIKKSPYRFEADNYICSKCKILKPKSSFYTSHSKKLKKVMARCKICVREYNRCWRQNHPGRAAIVTRKWRDNNYDAYKFNHLHTNAKKRGIYIKLDKEKFLRWFNSQSKNCFYCGIAEEDIKILYKIPRHSKLHIDRANNSLGYVIDNIVLACIRCNIMKGDILTKNEMLEIAQKYVTPKVKERLECLKNKKL